MSNLQSKIQRYPLLPYSQLVWGMMRWMPGVYRFSAVLRWKGGTKEMEHIENAIRLALANHPVFSTRVDSVGLHFASERKDVLHGQYHNINISVAEEDLLIKVELNRILGDGVSMLILCEDVERAYRGLPLEPDDYWGYVARYEQQKAETHYTISHDWLMNEFADDSIPVRPTIDRRWLATLLPPKAGLYEDDYTALHEKIESLKEEQFISYEGIFSLAASLAIADYCGTESAALTWAYEGRETKEEQRIFGSLHRDIPFRIRKSKIENRESAIRFARNQIRSGIAHSDYPYTLTAPYNKRWNYAVNVLRVESPKDMQNKTLLPVEIVSVPRQKFSYALLDVEIHEKEESLQLIYRYSSTHYKPESIRKFADIVRKYVLWLIND